MQEVSNRDGEGGARTGENVAGEDVTCGDAKVLDVLLCVSELSAAGFFREIANWGATALRRLLQPRVDRHTKAIPAYG